MLPRLLKVAPGVYPHLNEMKFHYLRLNEAKNMWVSRVPQSKFEANGSRCPEFWSDKLTDVTGLQIHICRDDVTYFTIIFLFPRFVFSFILLIGEVNLIKWKYKIMKTFFCNSQN